MTTTRTPRSPRFLGRLTVSFRPLALALVAGALLVGGCNFDITDPNTPTQIGTNPSPEQVSAAVIGTIIAARSDYAGSILRMGIMGREAYRIDESEPRYISELLHGPLDPGSGFGGGQWAAEYAAIRSGYNLLNVLPTASQLTAAQKAGAQGVVQTMQALVYMRLLDAHTEDSIPIDVNRPITDPPAPFVTNAAAWTHVIALLDSARTALNAAGSSFAFALPPGFAGFDAPATFLQFNRALMARAENYLGSLGCQACYDSTLVALSESFVDSTKPMDLGVYFDYSTGTGDVANSLSQDPATAIQLVHPSIKDSVELKADSTPDNRYLAKVTDRGDTLTSNGHSSALSWIRYPSPSSPIPIIRNEELLLIRAEAENGATTRDAIGAAADINEVRTKSGGLAPILNLAALAQDSIVGLLLRERKYSLLYEGHRWVDMRRFGRLSDVIIDPGTGDQVFSTLPIPLAETLARQ